MKILVQKHAIQDFSLKLKIKDIAFLNVKNIATKGIFENAFGKILKMICDL